MLRGERIVQVQPSGQNNGCAVTAAHFAEGMASRALAESDSARAAAELISGYAAANFRSWLLLPSSKIALRLYSTVVGAPALEVVVKTVRGG